MSEPGAAAGPGPLVRRGGEFRCAFFAADYERSLAFYGGGLGLERIESWDRGPDDRGTLFAAGGGVIEVLARPEAGVPEGPWDGVPPCGVVLVIEVADVRAAFERVRERRLKIREPLADLPWGHRAFYLEDPDGLVLYLFSEIAEAE